MYKLEFKPDYLFYYYLGSWFTRAETLVRNVITVVLVSATTTLSWRTCTFTLVSSDGM